MSPRPDAGVSSGVLYEEDVSDYNSIVGKKRSQRASGQRSYEHLAIIWRNVVILGFLHAFAVYGLKLLFTDALPKTIAWTAFLYVLTAVGVGCGAHRLWTHKSYKAKLPLRIFLTVAQTVAYQGPVYDWARDHRSHHKFTETDADPNNTERGIFFAHIGWVMCQKHPDVMRMGKTLDLSDLKADPCVTIQRRYYWKIAPIMAFVIPSVIPALFWGESLVTAYFTAGAFRTVLLMNAVFLINSLSHSVGTKPYDKTLAATDNWITNVMTFGEGWHNYHHVFPWDYRTGEPGRFGYLTAFSSGFLDLMALLGQTYDLKTASPENVMARALRTGDGSRKT